METEETNLNIIKPMYDNSMVNIVLSGERTSLVAQLVKNPPAMWETWIQSLGWEDPLEKKRLPTPVFWSREYHGLYSPWGCKELDPTK